ncbi:uncharacterized protein LOC129318075 isoform X2 [Prosopis cineraria]|uniref:uncharacterized protein LOC129318075 isoform X2 n=1 Tax=Prosopis cineraria TaxID=364024 RepID=UPI00240EA3AC|nr:uncharacterized protein LOC129318075 isoform X2 [Prosopis cineraria]
MAVMLHSYVHSCSVFASKLLISSVRKELRKKEKELCLLPSIFEMAFPGEGILTDLAKRLADKTITEVNYFRHFDTHVCEFEQQHNELDAKFEEVNNDIEDAKRKNENPTKDVEVWKDKAYILIQENRRIKQTWSYSSCPHWRYRQGKRLAKRMLAIKDHIQKCSFERVAHPAKLPGIKYHVLGDFIDFESRKSKLKQLVEALEDGNHHMVGLQGMGGTGKTTLATQVGKQIEESKAFEKVIFVVVSNPPEISKIRDDIARQLGLPLDKAAEADHSKLLWSRISNKERKLLIILDDVWEKLNLTNIGIPSGPDHKNCYVLITTRHSRVCEAMRCQKTIHLYTLTDEDALNLFLFHATSNNGLSRKELEDLAPGFVKECGGLPIAIASLASTLRIWPVSEWKEALATLRKSEKFLDIDEDLVQVYRCLSLSYGNLRNEKAQKLFLLCSIFPEDYEIPINLIIRLGIGAGIFGKVENYCAGRSQVLGVKNELVASTLLLKVDEKECVKMHDLVREVALWMAKEDIQVIMDSRTALETSKRIVFWSTNDFPDQFDGAKLEILFLWIKGDVLVKNPETLFAGVAGLSILFLLGRPKKHSIPSLSQSLLSLKNMQTLILDGWELGDISILKNLQSLVTLELKNCIIIELPKDIKELKKLRLLGLRKCEIQKNNPFKVIETCSQLEELYFVKNEDVEDWKLHLDKETRDEITHDISPPILGMFSIACDGYEYFNGDDNGLLRCFNTKHVEDLISKSMFKYIVGRGEVLELGKREETGWKCLIPDIIPVKDGGMNDLIKLCLYEWDEIEYLIDTRKHCYSEAFSRLVELHLNGVDVKELCGGLPPSGFLKKLQILNLRECKKLHNIFFDVNFKVPHLKILTLRNCPMFQPSIFPLFVAQSLVQLENFTIGDCEDLKSLITYESLGNELGDVDNQKSYGLPFPKLKNLKIEGCHKLELVSPFLLAGDLPLLEEIYIWNCKELKYIFGKYQNEGHVLHQENELPSLKTMRLSSTPNFISIVRELKKCMPVPSPVLKEDSKEKNENSKMSAFSWAPGCCFLPATKDSDSIGASNGTMQHHHQISSELPASMELIQSFHEAKCLMSKPLKLQNIRYMEFWDCSKLKSLFSVSIAKTVMLERLKIGNCEELKHIITNEVEDDDHLNCTSIFPNLESLRIWNCNKLEFIFPSTFFGGLQKLKSIGIHGASELKHVFGKYDPEDYVSNENGNNEPHINLPALETLSLQEVPNIISIHIKKYHLECPSLQTVKAPKEFNLQMHDVMSGGAKASEKKEIVDAGRPVIPNMGIEYVLNFHTLKVIRIGRFKKLKTMFVLSSWKNLPQLSELCIADCEELIDVVEDDSKNYDHINYSSVFSKLEYLTIRGCNKLEFILPHSLFSGLQKLKYLSVHQVAELKYIFGKHHQGDYASNENESDEVHIDFPALVYLDLGGVPKMINISCAKNYHLSFPSLQDIGLDDCQEINGRSFLDLMVCLQGRQSDVKTEKDLMKIIKDMQRLTCLGVRNSKIQEVFNLEEVKIEGSLTLSLEIMWLKNLSELRHIWKAPKYMLSLHNLRRLELKACEKLRSIFHISELKSLPSLHCLEIEDCEALVHIIEEDYEESAHDQFHQLFFPTLKEICIRRCNSLKCLFLISTSAMFPRLRELKIEESLEMEQVIACKQHHTQKMVVKDVFPKLSNLTLGKLPRLVTICGEIDFRSVQSYEVVDCPKYQQITSRLQGGPEDLDSKNQASTEGLLSAHSNNAHQMPHMGETSASRNSTESKEETIMEIKSKGPPPALEKQALDTATAESQSRRTCLHGLEDEYIKNESIVQPQHQDLEETKSSIEACHKTNTLFHDESIDDKLKERVQEGSPSEDMVQATMLANLVPRNSSSTFTTPCQEELPLDWTKIESRRETSMTHRQELGEMNVVKSFPEDTAIAETKMIDREAGKEVDEVVPASKLPETTSLDFESGNESIPEETISRKAKINTSSICSKAETSQSNPPAQITPSNKVTLEQELQESYATEEAITANRSINLKQSRSVSVLEKEKPQSVTESIPEHTTPMKAKINTSSIYSKEESSQLDPPVKVDAKMKGTLEHYFEGHDASEEAIVAIQSTDSESMKQSRVPSVIAQLSSEKATKASLDEVIPPLHRESQIGVAGSSSSKMGIGEILELVDLKDGEPALLAKALELCPQLRLSHEQHLPRAVIAFSYRVLCDILIILATKTPCTITTSDKSTLEQNLEAATFLGFDKGWIETVQDKVLGIDMSDDVMAAEEEIQVVKAELETCDIALEQVRKQRVEIKERLAVMRRNMETVQSEFEAIDSQLLSLLEGRKKLTSKMAEFRERISIKHRPFGI